MFGLLVRLGRFYFLARWKYFGTKLSGSQGVSRKHAFLSLVAAKDRMVTRDKLLRRGLTVPPTCVLCVGYNERRQHLFFFFIVTTICKCGLSSSLD